MVTGAAVRRENSVNNKKYGIKVVIRGERTLYCSKNATEAEINAIFAESEDMERAKLAWQAKGSPWTEDDEAFLNRMSA